MKNILPTSSRAKDFFQLALSRRLFPLFWTQFGGAFNDNLYKSGFVVILVYRLLEPGSEQGGVLVNLTQAVFILPFILFAAIAGSLGDRHDKSLLIRRIKLAEILLALLAGAALFSGNLTALICIIFLLSVQSTFFGPLKYGILPQHVPPEALMGGNGLLNAGTFIAITAGTLIGAYVATLPHYAAYLSGILLLVAAAGYLSSRFIPPAPPLPDFGTSQMLSQKKISFEPFGATVRLLRKVYVRQPQNRPYLLGVSWFWFVGSVLLTQIPILTEKELGLEDVSVSFFMVVFAAGISVGALATGIFLRGRSTSKYAAATALLIALLSLDMILAMRQFGASAPLPLDDAGYVTLRAFLSQFHGIRLSVDFFLLSASGGFYVIPLFTVLLRMAKPGERASVVAVNNILNALFMVVSALAVMLIYAWGGGLSLVFSLITLSALVVGVLWHRTRRTNPLLQ